MKSKTKLFEALDTYFGTNLFTRLKLEMVGNETYGKKSFIYVHTDGPSNRRGLEKFLEDRLFKVNHGYAPGSGVVEVQVSYFRGNRWDE